MTYNELAQDIETTLSMDHDDALRSRPAILYNVLLAVNKLKDQQLTKQVKAGDARAASSMTSTFIVPVVHRDVPDNSTSDWDACYFDLPTSVYSLPNDRGVVFVRYLQNDIDHGCPPAVARVPFSSSTLASVSALYGSKWQAPNPSRPYYARGREQDGNSIKDRVYVFGVRKTVKHLLVGLYAAPDFTTFNPDDPVDLPDELFFTLKKMVLDMEAWLLQIPQERLKNDGRDFEPNQQIRVSRLQSVNDPSQIDD
jgi:hypothetical protein